MFSLLMTLVLAAPDKVPPAPAADAPALAAKIDEFVEKHWQSLNIKPTHQTSDAAFLRRVTLDLLGRIPTVQETKAFLDDKSPDKRARLIERLIRSPEYPLHMGRVLDSIVQDKTAGDGGFVEYLRSAVAARKPWDQVFRDILLGPWDDKERQGADRFLLERVKSLDDMTTDTSRVFFGVNVSCAKCHDHPLVPDWLQDHYYGMASFFNRTAGGKGKGGGKITEKTSGDVSFTTRKGEKKTARVMFLSGKVIEDGKNNKVSAGRREQLVEVALEQKTFFSRAIVNHLWAYFLGRGLVHPTDQMHSANPPSVPALLEWLGEDLATHNYDLNRVVAGIVSSRVYQLSSKQGNSTGTDKDFAQAQLRPLTPEQYALSMMLLTGEDTYDEAKEEARGKRYRELEGQASRLTKLQLIDPRSDRYQSSTGEALFMSNHEEIQRLLQPSGKNLAARLAALTDPRQMVETAIWSVLNRPPEGEDLDYLVKWVESKPDRARACRQLVWALMTSAEFRFNY